MADTIVALSSGAVPAGVAIIRLSGPQAGSVLMEILGRIPTPRRLHLTPIRLDGELLDKGLVAFMPGPNSFTGEDCGELHLHGSPAVVRAVLRRLSDRPGLRLAEPGEFSRRAFDNGKLDLVEAQGLGDLIEAETENQRALALSRMEGGLTRRIEGWRERLLDLRALIESQLDFSDEGDVGDLPTSFMADVDMLTKDIGSVLALRGQGRIIRTGYRVVLVGPPNAGKSSLLNALSKSDVAIVSDEAGTTRDLKEVPLDIKGQLIILIDSAGLRETESKAEAMGVGRARSAMAHADVILWLQAPDIPIEAVPADLQSDHPFAPPATVVRVATKADIGPVPNCDVAVSAETGQGIEEMLDGLYQGSGASRVNAADVLVSHEQDRAALLKAHGELARVKEVMGQSELAAECLRLAGQSLERLLGRVDSEHVLDRLFARFCIGK